MVAYEKSPPKLALGELQEIASRHFGIRGPISALDGYHDLNAKIEADSGAYVLKVANSGESADVLAMQNAVLRHLQRVAPDIGVPRIVAAKDGSDIVKIRRGGEEFLVRAVTFLPGPLLAAVPTTPELAKNFGAFLGRFSRAMQGFGHSAAHRNDFPWNLDSASKLSESVDDVEARDIRKICREALKRHELLVSGRLPKLRAATLHQDANDYNVVLSATNREQVAGLIDFGDVVFGRQINELAVAMAYALMGATDFWGVASGIVAGYASEFPLDEPELEVLFDQMRMRAVMSVCMSSKHARQFPDNSYLRISQEPASALLRRLSSVDEALAELVFRNAAGFLPVAQQREICRWLDSEDIDPAGFAGFELGSARRFVSRAASRSELENAYDWKEVNRLKSEFNADIGFGLPPDPADRMQRGIGRLDIFLPGETAVRSIFPGGIIEISDGGESGGEFGGIVVQHSACDGQATFYSGFEFLGGKGLREFSKGDPIAAGEIIGKVPAAPGSDLGICRIRCATSKFQAAGTGSGNPVILGALNKTSLDPRLILRTELGSPYERSASNKSLLDRRRRVLGPSLSLAYRDSLHIVSGNGAYLFDREGRRYLDCVNNIAHVGHGHPGVADAVARQARTLNTNTRYLSKLRLDYAERLARKLPEPLSVIYLTCTGSEANELALRIARAHTGRRGIAVLDWAYHGNTTSLVEISPYKFKRSGGFAKPDHVEIAELPAGFPIVSEAGAAVSGVERARSVGECVRRMKTRLGQGPAAFFAESVAGVAGQIFYPAKFLRAAFDIVREAGGVCVADEVQCGFGRMGDCFWGFQYQDAVPDIVTFGKPAANGHPLAGVATTAELAATFANGMEYFNSFGGNQVSAAAGQAVLDALDNEGLMENADATGRSLKGKLVDLGEKFDHVGEIRGKGLFLGIELVGDGGGLAAAGATASWISNELRANGVLVSTDGPNDNVLKIKPPLCFGRKEADLLCDALARALSKASGRA